MTEHDFRRHTLDGIPAPHRRSILQLSNKLKMKTIWN